MTEIHATKLRLVWERVAMFRDSTTSRTRILLAVGSLRHGSGPAWQRRLESLCLLRLGRDRLAGALRVFIEAKPCGRRIEAEIRPVLVEPWFPLPEHATPVCRRVPLWDVIARGDPQKILTTAQRGAVARGATGRRNLGRAIAWEWAG